MNLLFFLSDRGSGRAAAPYLFFAFVGQMWGKCKTKTAAILINKGKTAVFIVTPVGLVNANAVQIRKMNKT